MMMSNFTGKPLMQREGLVKSVFLYSAPLGVLQTKMRAADCSRAAVGELVARSTSGFPLFSIEQGEILTPPPGLTIQVC